MSWRVRRETAEGHQGGCMHALHDTARPERSPHWKCACL